MVSDRRTVIEMMAGRKTTGEPVFEEVLVDAEGDGNYRVVATPGLVLGIAAGDLVHVQAPRAESFEVVERGGNLAIHIYGPHRLVNRFVSQLEAIGGTLDGRAHDLTVFTVPVKVGFARLESLLNEISKTDSDLEWYYGNVYDDDGVTPLEWPQAFLKE